MRSRRALLAAAPALLLAGCGSSSSSDAPSSDPDVDLGTQRQGDVALLSQLLEADERASLAYENDGRARGALVAGLERDHEAHRQALEGAIRALGGRPPALGHDQPRVGFRSARVAESEGRMLALLLDVTPKLADGRLRELCAGILADKAGRIAQLRIAAGQDAVPKAFVT